MTLYCFDIRKNLIEPALAQAGLDHKGLPELLEAIAFAEQESQSAGRYGPFGMTAQMHQLVWDFYIARSPELACQIRGLASQRRFLIDPHQELSLNWAYAAIMAALNCLYYCPHSLPGHDQVDAACELWRQAFHQGEPVSDTRFKRHFAKSCSRNHVAA